MVSGKLYHIEPDGDRLSPHHHYTGLHVAILGLLLFTPSIPVLAAGLATALGGYLAMLVLWHEDGRPVAGAVGSVSSGAILTGIGIATMNPVLTIGGLVSLDDTIQHTTGIKTPLDQWWKNGLKDFITSHKVTHKPYKVLHEIPDVIHRRLFE